MPGSASFYLSCLTRITGTVCGSPQRLGAVSGKAFCTAALRAS
jgi:hypothetical protein